MASRSRSGRGCWHRRARPCLDRLRGLVRHGGDAREGAGLSEGHPLVQSAPKPLFSEIRSETVDGSLAQTYHLAKFGDGFGHLEGVREERSQGTARSGAQTVSMVTALGGLVLSRLDNKTHQGGRVPTQHRAQGETCSHRPTTAALAMKYERIQISETAVVEEIRDCMLTWLAPLDDAPRLSSRCTGSTKVSQPKKDGTIQVSNAPDTITSTLVYRRDLG
ncbi:MAG: hypothetical protein WDO24_22530 [Pseudomonadota bacterium]